MLGTPITINALDLPLTSPLAPSTTLQTFTSCIYKHQLLRSAQHERSTVRNDDRYVQTYNCQFLRICEIVVQNGATVHIYGIKIYVRPLLCGGVELPHMFEADISEEAMTCRVEDIARKCTLIEVDNGKYICTFPNKFEKH